MGQIENDQHSSLNELPSEIYQQTLKNIIKNNFDSPPEACNIVIEAGSAKGDNYIGVLYRANIKDPKGNELSVIIKLPPENVARREQFFARPSFLRESEFYDAIFPMFRKFQEEKGIDVEKDGFYQVPSCYKTLTEEPLEGLFLEDLKVSGFEMFDRFKDVTVDHVNRVMESLGKFHALSFAIKDQKPELIAPYKDMTDILAYRGDLLSEQFKTWFESLKVQAIGSLSDSSNDDLKQKVKEILKDNFYEMLEPCVNGAAAEPYAVLCHGDCWNNNIMFRNENGMPVEIRIIDWQIMRYSSPVCDLLYYIFACTTKGLRDKHYNDFLDVYYKSLSNFLTRLGSNPTKLFPRDILDDHMKRYAKFGIVMTILVLPLITSKAEDTLDMDKMAEQLMGASDNGAVIESTNLAGSEKNIVYNERMRAVFEDMYKFNYF